MIFRKEGSSVEMRNSSPKGLLEIRILIHKN